MKKYIKNQIQILKDDIKYLNKNFKDLDSFNVELKKTIKKYTLKINESKDLNEKKEYTDKLGRYYNLLYYINFLKNEDKMYLLDDELTSLPPVYIVDQKPELFTVDQELLDNINIQEGLEEEQALELLKWTSNNTRSNISKSKKMDLYDNCDLCGYCGFSQFSSLYPLKKWDLKSQ